MNVCGAQTLRAALFILGAHMGKKIRIPVKLKLGYGIGALSYAIPFQIISGFFLFYANSVLGISGTLSGTIIAVSIFWDAFTDPIMGYISDKTSPKVLFGRRLFYVFIGAIGLAISNFFLWSIDVKLPGLAKAVILGLMLILVKTFSTIFTTPYLALGAELSNDYDERTSVQSFRTAFYFLGFMFPVIVGLGIFKVTDNTENFSLFALTTSIIIIVCAAISIAVSRRKSLFPSAKKTRRSGFIGLLKESGIALKCNDFRNISITLLFVNMAMGVVSAAGLHTFSFTFYLGDREKMIVLGSLFAMALIAQPIWVIIARRFEKKIALKACLFINLGVAIAFLIYVLNNVWVSENYLAIVPLSVVMGFSIGGSIALPYSMISDTVDKDAYNTGVRKEGVFYGFATFMYKLSQAIAIFSIGALLDIIKFNADIVQDNSVYVKLGLIMPVGFIICFLGALYFTIKYTLNKKKVAEFQQNQPKSDL